MMSDKPRVYLLRYPLACSSHAYARDSACDLCMATRILERGLRHIPAGSHTRCGIPVQHANIGRLRFDSVCALCETKTPVNR